MTGLLHNAGQEAGSFSCCELLLLDLQMLEECSAEVQQPQQAGRVCSWVAQPDHTPPAPAPVASAQQLLETQSCAEQVTFHHSEKVHAKWRCTYLKRRSKDAMMGS